MSLLMDTKATLACMEIMRADGGWRTVWKKVRLQVEEMPTDQGTNEIIEAILTSPYQKKFEWEPGWIEAKGADIPLTLDEKLLNSGGLHTFFYKPDERDDDFYQCVDMPLRVHVDDLIAAGNIKRADFHTVQAVFKRAYLSYNDCEMSVKAGLELKREQEENLRQSGSICGTRTGRVTATQLAAMQSGLTQQILGQQQNFSQMFSQAVRAADYEVRWRALAGQLYDIQYLQQLLSKRLPPGSIIRDNAHGERIEIKVPGMGQVDVSHCAAVQAKNIREFANTILDRIRQHLKRMNHGVNYGMRGDV